MICRQMRDNGWIDRQTDRQVGDRLTHRQTDRQTGREGGLRWSLLPSVHRTYSKQPNRTLDIN